MQVGTLVIAGLFGTVGLVAGRATAPKSSIVVQEAPRPAPVVVFTPTPVVAPVVEAAADNDVDEDDGTGSDLGQVLANLHDQALVMRPDGNAVLGHITDQQTNDAAVGATVVATSPAMQGEQVVITDESGNFRFTGLPPGFYQLTIYWNDTTSFRNDVASREASATDVDIRLDSQQIQQEYVYNGPAPQIDPEYYGVEITTDTNTDYVKNIPTGRTFEATLGAAAGTQVDSYGDSLSEPSQGVDFSGSTANEYFVDGVMPPPPPPPAYPLSAVISTNEAAPPKYDQIIF